MTRQQLVTTALAAYHVGVGEASFHSWAARRGLKSVRKVRVGRSTVCLWDMNEVFAATKITPRPWRTKEKTDG